MNMKRFKKRIAAMMTVSTLAIWFALPSVAHAETLIIEGRHVYTNITVSASSATATISYTEGSGQIYAFLGKLFTSNSLISQSFCVFVVQL